MKKEKTTPAGAECVPAGDGIKQPVTLAVSLAGHDKGRAYLVQAEEEDFLWLTDGRLRPLSRPKKKKRIHLQLVKKLPQNAAAAAYCGSGERWQDMDTRRVLAAWMNH